MFIFIHLILYRGLGRAFRIYGGRSRPWYSSLAAARFGRDRGCQKEGATDRVLGPCQDCTLVLSALQPGARVFDMHDYGTFVIRYSMDVQ